MSINIKVTCCKKCPWLIPEDEIIDEYHGCLCINVPPRCGRKLHRTDGGHMVGVDLDKNKLDVIPRNCPYKNTI